MMKHQHGCHLHHYHAGHHLQAGHHLHGGHHIYGGHHIHTANHVNRSRLRYPRATPVFVGHLGSHLVLMKLVMGVIGAVLLTVSISLLLCGILNFAGVIAGETFSLGIPLLGFGGVLFIGGLLFIALACMAMKASTTSQEQTTDGGASSYPTDQPVTDPQSHNSLPTYLPPSAPPPYSPKSVQVDQASAQGTYSFVGFNSVASPEIGYSYSSYAASKC